MISKQYFEETFSLATAQALQTWANDNLIYSVPPGDNPYLEPVDIPIYNSGDSTHVLVTTSNGNMSLVNDASKQHFYVEPGDYGNTPIVLSQDGTGVARRSMSLYNGNDTHPGALPIDATNLANLVLDITGDYWDIDRMASWSNTGEGQIRIWGQHNTINRFLVDNVNQGVMIRNGAHNNTVQNSRFQNQVVDDGAGIELNSWTGDAEMEIMNCKIINNETYRCNDGFQVVRNTNTSNPTYEQSVNVEGLIVDSNRFELDTSEASFENAMDFKGGSHNASNPVTVTNNFMQGYFEGNDKSCMVLHKRPANMVITDNVFYNSAHAINTGSSGLNIPEGADAGVTDSVISNNLMYDCGQSSRPVEQFSSVDNVQTENNVFIDCASYWGSFYGLTATSTFQANDICNSGDINNWEDRGGGNSSTFIDTLANNTIYATSTAGGYTEDLIIDYDLFTDTPKQATLTNAVKP